jgi:hypothetical protein
VIESESIVSGTVILVWVVSRESDECTQFGLMRSIVVTVVSLQGHKEGRRMSRLYALFSSQIDPHTTPGRTCVLFLPALFEISQ